MVIFSPIYLQDKPGHENETRRDETRRRLYRLYIYPKDIKILLDRVLVRALVRWCVARCD